MSDITLDVRLHGRRIGSLTNLSGDFTLLSFEEDWLDNPERDVLSQAFIGANGPVRRVPRTRRVAPPFLANLLPEDGSTLRALVARQYGIKATRDFPYLANLGRDLPGAIEIGAMGDGDETLGDGDEIDVEPRALKPFRFSLTGMQTKFSASWLANRLSIPVDGMGGGWIAKLPTNAYARLPENEMLVMSLARAIGLPVPETRLVPLDAIDGVPRELPVLRADEPKLAYVIERFDRSPGGRVHVEDFNQIANQKPSEKYDNRTSSWIAVVVAALCPISDVDDLVRRLVFGVCIGNDDMHLKNWALRYADGRTPRLAPLYDFVCVRAYVPQGQLALTIGGERRFERVGLDAIATFAGAAELSARRATTIARETVEALRAVWPAYRDRADDAGLSDVLERHFRSVPLMRLER